MVSVTLQAAESKAVLPCFPLFSMEFREASTSKGGKNPLRIVLGGWERADASFYLIEYVL